MSRTMLLFLNASARKTAKQHKPVEGEFLLVNERVISKEELGDYCNDCFEPLSYNEQYDACYCEPCNAWREAACYDPDCEYCFQRPKRPLF